ncbi:MAG: ribbon-helix-helix domain-containing protein [Deltaproteobacteria bacterium]|nr:MAG: ribbon-helix-helix domain-containing protein [Deltaproteobacteria bacterium]
MRPGPRCPPEGRGRGQGTVATNVLIPASHRRALRRLSERTRVAQSVYLREALADLLRKYAPLLDGEEPR